MAESPHHLVLKRLAFHWAREVGYRACATEVLVPKCHFRADLAACRPALRGATEPGVTAIFECKQSRADLLRDSAEAEAARANLRELTGRRLELEALLRVHHPSLANGDSLFAEWTSYSLEAVRHEGYQSVLRGIQAAQRRLRLRTKFEKLCRYRCANLCYLVMEEGLCETAELPLGWGVLVRKGEQLELQSKPVWQESDAATRLALLQRIASAGTRFTAAAFQEPGATTEEETEEPLDAGEDEPEVSAESVTVAKDIPLLIPAHACLV